MNCLEIINKYLEENDYDGLCNPEIGCGCHVNELALCGCDISDCEPGVEGVTDDGEIGIYLTKQEKQA